MSDHPAAQSATLDGRSFHGVVLEAGKTSGDADTLVFANGRFRSSACEQYEYGDGAYTSWRDGNGIRFTARLTMWSGATATFRSIASPNQSNVPLATRSNG